MRGLGPLRWSGFAGTRPSAVREPRIHYYAVSWNEEYILPNFFRHHKSLYDKITVLDDGSTDRTLQILSSEPNVVVRRAPKEASYISRNTRLYNEMWKEGRGEADWVVVGNLDEFIYAADLRGYLRECQRRKVTVVPTLGFEMIARERVPPDQDLVATVRRGAPNLGMCKVAIFDPNEVDEIGYAHGRHTARPAGAIRAAEPGRVLTLHYKRIGLEETFARYQRQDAQRSRSDRADKLGVHYGWGRDEFMREWEKAEADSLDVLDWYASGAAYPLQIPRNLLRKRPWWRRRKSAKVMEG
jgi:hypothetical protein